MVSYNYILKTIEDYTRKHSEYPKINALRYYEENKRKFRKEQWDEGVDHSSKERSPVGHIFGQQNELQKSVKYDKVEQWMIHKYSIDAFKTLSYYHHKIMGDLKYELKWDSMMNRVISSTRYSDSKEGNYWDEKDEENASLMRDSLIGDKDIGNWFYDPGYDMYKCVGEDGLYDTEKFKKMEKRWGEFYHQIKSPETLTTKDWQEMYKEMGLPTNLTLKDWSNGMSHLIEESPRMQTDCVAWRYGRLPLDKNGNIPLEGQEGKWDGFTGLTMNEKLIQKGSYLKDEAGWVDKENRYKIKVLMPHGTKCVALGDSVGCDPWQNEILLDKNQKCIIMDKDDKRKTATVLLY